MSSEVEAVARAICLQANLDEGYADNDVLRGSIEQGMWRNYIKQAKAAIAALDAQRSSAAPAQSADAS
jgi:hypothetical protein